MNRKTTLKQRLNSKPIMPMHPINGYLLGSLLVVFLLTVPETLVQ